MSSSLQAEQAEIEGHLPWNFTWGAAAGVFYQLGVAFFGTGTMLPAFLSHLSASKLMVGAADSIRGLGWLLPQLLTASYAQSRRYRKPIYLFAGFGRAACLFLLVVALLLWGNLPVGRSVPWLLGAFFIAWTGYSFVSGMAGVPYNDVVGRVIPSSRRSTFLAIRFFGGGLLAMGAGLLIRVILDQPGRFPFPGNYTLIFSLGMGVLILSTAAFALIREPPAPIEEAHRPFDTFFREGLTILRRDRRFRLFYAVRILTGLTAMALPFYVVQAWEAGLSEAGVGTLLSTQMAGNLLATPLWGWWGDRLGKLSLLRVLAGTAVLSPALALIAPTLTMAGEMALVAWYSVTFFVIGVVINGERIADLGYLMEISPDGQRAEYTGLMNTMLAPIRLLPMAGAVLVGLFSFSTLFAVALVAVGGRLWTLNRLADSEREVLCRSRISVGR